jgi:hypothetical protein
MPTVTATTPVTAPPAWAVLERRLFEVMDAAVRPFLEKYTRPDGWLIWADSRPSRDGADDFYESFYNWPLLYLLGGGDHLLTLGQRQWEAMTEQLTHLGLVYKEYERGYDQFHQGESYIAFYHLCMADPTNARNRERARRFAGLYLNEEPEAPNYDPERRLIRAPHNGSAGPRAGFTDGDPAYHWSASMARYGLPYHDVPGIDSFDDLKDPEKARRMGEVMAARLGRGDVPANLAVTSLMTNAYCLTGDEKYRAWVLEYTDAWIGRARENGGLLPDNVGLSGQIGEYIDGKWFGGLYGWTWPHGFYNIGMAAIVAASNAALLTRDTGYLDLPRTHLDRLMELGAVRDVGELAMSLSEHWVGQMAALGAGRELFVVPYRYGDYGWFDWQPLSPVFPAAVWSLSQEAADWERLERLRAVGGYDWRVVISFRNKEDCGHEEPWLRYLAGDNPDYPAAILAATYGQVCRRLALIRQDEADLTQVHIHHWQQLNPVITEALIQLTLGAPAPIYNGGLLLAPLRYFDAERRRPGLPADVAALVETVERERVVVQLINLSPLHDRTVIIQAGAMREHRFTYARYDRLASDYPGAMSRYAAEPVRTEPDELAIDGGYLRVTLPAGRQARLELGLERLAQPPTYALPWEDAPQP